MTPNPSQESSDLNRLIGDVESMRSNLAEINKVIEQVSTVLVAKGLINTPLTAPSASQPEGPGPAPTKQTVYVLTYIDANWQGEIQTWRDPVPVHMNRMRLERPTRITLSIYQSKELAKEAGKIWARKQLERRRDASDPALREQPAGPDVPGDWYEQEYPGARGVVLDGGKGWEFWIRRPDDREELGVAVQEWVVEDAPTPQEIAGNVA